MVRDQRLLKYRGWSSGAAEKGDKEKVTKAWSVWGNRANGAVISRRWPVGDCTPFAIPPASPDQGVSATESVLVFHSTQSKRPVVLQGSGRWSVRRPPTLLSAPGQPSRFARTRLR